jgi:hypothetical protein
MAKRWDPDEDAFLITWSEAAGANFVASHDLGRPDGAGARRLRHLDKSGASIAFFDYELARVEFMRKAGHFTDDEASWYREELQNKRNAAALRAVK